MTARDLGLCCALGAALVATSAGAASMDLSKDIVGRGAKPAWELKVSRGTQISLTRPGKPAVQATAPGAAISPSGANWTAKTAKGEEVKVSLQSRACTLGGTQYPMTAQVTLAGETLTGCASHGS